MIVMEMVMQTEKLMEMQAETAGLRGRWGSDGVGEAKAGNESVDGGVA